MHDGETLDVFGGMVLKAIETELAVEKPKAEAEAKPTVKAALEASSSKDVLVRVAHEDAEYKLLYGKQYLLLSDDDDGFSSVRQTDLPVTHRIPNGLLERVEQRKA